MNGYSRLALIGTIVAFGAFATAAVLFVQTGNDSLQRLALLFGLFGVTVPSVIGVLKADRAETQTGVASNIAQALNGDFDRRVQDAVQRGNAASERGAPIPPVLHRNVQPDQPS